MSKIGTSLASLGSTLNTIRALIIEVEISHQNAKLTKYLTPDLEWF
jgi:hypothetical protein